MARPAAPDVARDQGLRARADGPRRLGRHPRGLLRGAEPRAGRAWGSPPGCDGDGVARRSADPRGDADRVERGAVAGDDHRHLPGGRHPQAAAGDAAAAAHHPRGARPGEADLHRDVAGRHDPRRPTLLSGAAGRAAGLVRRRPALRHAVHPVDRVPDREPGADGAVRPAARRAAAVPDACRIGALRAGGRAAARRAGAGPRAAADLRGIAAARGLAR